MFDQAPGSTKPAIVLVHGAWADATSWNGVIPQLQSAGLRVFAPPNQLRSIVSDAASVAAFIKSIPGPLILVGHSYGGAVISAASPGNPNIKALVYIDAFALEEGESCLSVLPTSPAPPADLFTPVPLPSGDADLFFTTKYYGVVFASDVPAPAAALMAVTQRPLTASALNEKASSNGGWKTIPSWYVVGDADLVIPPPVQMKMAQRAKSTITHVNGSHPSMIQHPEATVAAVVAAVEATSK